MQREQTIAGREKKEHQPNIHEKICSFSSAIDYGLHPRPGSPLKSVGPRGNVWCRRGIQLSEDVCFNRETKSSIPSRVHTRPISSLIAELRHSLLPKKASHAHNPFPYAQGRRNHIREPYALSYAGLYNLCGAPIFARNSVTPSRLPNRAIGRFDLSLSRRQTDHFGAPIAVLPRTRTPLPLLFSLTSTGSITIIYTQRLCLTTVVQTNLCRRGI